MNREIPVRNKIISSDNLYFLAECGNQFGGSVEKAKKLIDVCAYAGADAVKFIFWFPDEIMSEDCEYSYQVRNVLGNLVTVKGSMFELLDSLRLTTPEWWDVRNYALKRGVHFWATVNSPGGFELAENLMMDGYKLSTWDWNYTDLWRWVARTCRPVIADMGAVTLKEIDRNIKLFLSEHNDNLAFLHCHHTDNPSQVNIRAITAVNEMYNSLCGYAASGRDDTEDIMAVTLGACILEKRVTLDVKGGELHDVVSLEPDEFKNYIEKMKRVKRMVGECNVLPSDKDLESRKKYFRRLVADENIQEGEVITTDKLKAVRGEYGVSPEYSWEFYGKRAKRAIHRNGDIGFEDVREAGGS